MFPGYFNDPVASKECFDENGWYKSQDIVEIFPNGSIQFICRTSLMTRFLEPGKSYYFFPKEMESFYSQSSLLSYVYVEGRSP